MQSESVFYLPEMSNEIFKEEKIFLLFANKNVPTKLSFCRRYREDNLKLL